MIIMQGTINLTYVIASIYIHMFIYKNRFDELSYYIRYCMTLTVHAKQDKNEEAHLRVLQIKKKYACKFNTHTIL